MDLIIASVDGRSFRRTTSMCSRFPILRGRAFTEQDDTGAPAVVIINEAMAQGIVADERPTW